MLEYHQVPHTDAHRKPKLFVTKKSLRLVISNILATRTIPQVYIRFLGLYPNVKQTNTSSGIGGR